MPVQILLDRIAGRFSVPTTEEEIRKAIDRAIREPANTVALKRVATSLRGINTEKSAEFLKSLGQNNLLIDELVELAIDALAYPQVCVLAADAILAQSQKMYIIQIVADAFESLRNNYFPWPVIVYSDSLGAENCIGRLCEMFDADRGNGHKLIVATALVLFRKHPALVSSSYTEGILKRAFGDKQPVVRRMMLSGLRILYDQERIPESYLAETGQLLMLGDKLTARAAAYVLRFFVPTELVLERVTSWNQLVEDGEARRIVAESLGILLESRVQ